LGWTIHLKRGKIVHIMEGFLPSPWWIIWFVISIPIIIYGIYKLSKINKQMPETKPLLALMGAFIFLLSALKLPSLVGSSSHPTGSGFAAIFFGPAIASVLSLIVLVFQALLLAHGGLTTLGANVFSMGIAGPAVAYGVWILCRKARLSASTGVFAAVALSGLVTYVVTAFQLALAVPIGGGFLNSFVTFIGIYAITQIPLAIAEGILAVLIFSFLVKYKSNILSMLKVIKIPSSTRENEVKT
jgi:cobalt/nickel transport system permease protein